MSKKIFYLFLFHCLGCQLIIGQHTTFQIDHYAINVTDLNKSVAFYQDLFSLDEIYDGTEEEHIRWFNLGNNQELHIIKVDTLDLKLPKGVHLALTTDNLPAFIEKLTFKKVLYFDWPGKQNMISVRPDLVKQIYIQDPDGYWIEINDGLKRYKVRK